MNRRSQKNMLVSLVVLFGLAIAFNNCAPGFKAQPLDSSLSMSSSSGDGSSSGNNGSPPTLPPMSPPAVTTTPTPAPVYSTGNYPTWRNGLQMGVFSPINNTSRMNGTTTNVGTIDAWNGLASSSSAWYSVLNGGHADSSENKVMKLDLTINTPAWVLLSAGSANPGAPDALYYPDGLPASRHTYYTTHFISARNRLMSFGAAALWGTGNGGGPAVDGFNLATNTWDPAGSYANTPFVGTVPTIAKHPVTEDIYFANGGKFAKWTQATGTWSMLTIPGNPQWMFKPSIIDVSRNRWVLAVGQVLAIIDLSNLSYSTLPITGLGAASVGDYGSLTHDLDNDRYVTCLGDGQVFSINPTTGAATLITTVTVPTWGPMSRFTYFKSLGGIGYLPNFNSNVLFMPTR